MLAITTQTINNIIVNERVNPVVSKDIGSDRSEGAPACQTSEAKLRRPGGVEEIPAPRERERERALLLLLLLLLLLIIIIMIIIMIIRHRVPPPLVLSAQRGHSAKRGEKSRRNNK